MEYYLEKISPEVDLGGVCECFMQTVRGLRMAAKPHVHQHFELLYCEKGGFDLRVGEREYCLAPGDAALIHPMEPHQTTTRFDGENSYLVLKFVPEALYSAREPLHEIKCILPYLHFSDRRVYVYTKKALEGSGMEEILHRILRERQTCEYGYEMALRAYVQQVLLWFIRAWREQNGAVDVDENAVQRLQRALAYIAEHLDEPVSVADAAASCNMGRSTFSRFFSRAAGVSFPAYVRSMRLSRAVALLVGTNRSVTDIALETGFSTASYLILCFREQYHMTPAQFREVYCG